MKNLDQFLIEKKKEKESGAPKVRHPDSGEEDEMYFKLMTEYKSKRRKDPKEANKILDKAEELINSGKVSNGAIMGAAYL